MNISDVWILEYDSRLEKDRRTNHRHGKSRELKEKRKTELNVLS